MSDPKLRKYENKIYKLKKDLEFEKKSLREVKTECAKEIEQRNLLEKILRQCVDDVKNEMERKRTESKVNFYSKGPRMSSAVTRHPDRNLSQAERNKILEVLMS